MNGADMRLLSLDVLRGIAVLLVIVRHSDAAWDTWLAPVRRGGWVGVDLFFVLSGFLVSGLLFHEFETRGSIRPGRFLIRRGWKIYPAFFVLIAVSPWFTPFGSDNPWLRTVTEFTFTQSYVAHRWWPHTWSIAVEEHFYLLLPFLLIPLSKTRFASLPRIVFGIMVALLIAKCINSLRPFSEQTHLFPTHLRLDGLFFGVLLQHWYRSWAGFRDWGEKNAKALIAAGCLLLAPSFLFNIEQVRGLYSYWLTANILGSGAILIGLVCGGVRVNPVTRLLGWIGFYSYSIYLWHNFAVFAVSPALGVNSVAFNILAAVAIGITMSKLIEGPCLRLRERLTLGPGHQGAERVPVVSEVVGTKHELVGTAGHVGCPTLAENLTPIFTVVTD